MTLILEGRGHRYCPTFERILVGRDASKRVHLWYQTIADGDEIKGVIYLGRDSEDVLEMEDIDAKNIQLTSGFSFENLETMEGRKLAYDTFGRFWMSIFSSDGNNKRPASLDPDCAATRKRHKKEIITATNDHWFLRGKLYDLKNTMEFLGHIDNAIKASSENLVAHFTAWASTFITLAPMKASLKDLKDTMDVYPLSTFEDIPPIEMGFQSIEDMAIHAYFQGNFTDLSEYIHYVSLKPALDVLQGLRRVMVPALFEIKHNSNRGQESYWKHCDHVKRTLETTKTMMPILPRLMDQVEKMAAYRKDVIAPFLVDAIAPLTEDERKWWDTATFKSRQNKLEEQWEAVQLDRQYFDNDRCLIRERLNKLIACLRYDAILVLPEADRKLGLYLKRLLQVKREVDARFKDKF
ncbi:hypothetical protein HDK64DRAFT_255252 [Phyllosticta capitalensis]